jgi:O-antigen/teichoic acid export membrane protein
MEPHLIRPRALAPGAALSATTQVAGAASAALVAVALARLLGPEGLGAYTIAVSLLLMLTTLGTLGLESGIVHFVGAGAWPPRRAWLETQVIALLIGLVGGGAGLGARLVAPGAFEGLSVGLVAVVVAALPFAVSALYASSIALATDRYEDYATPMLVQALALLAAVPPLAALYGLTGAAAGLAAAPVLGAAAAALRNRRALAGRAAEHGRAGLRRAAAFGAKTHAANALQLLNYRLDFFVLNAAGAQAAVGRYSVAVSVTSLCWILPRALSSVVFPRVSALTTSGEDSHAYREIVETKSLRHGTLLAFASAGGVAIVLVALVPPVFGAEFRSAVWLGLILLPGVTLLGIASVLMASVVGRGRPEYALYVALASTPVTIGLYAALIPPLEATGAAVASCLSYALSFVLALVAYRRATGRRIGREMLPTRAELDDYLLVVGRR